MKIFLIVDKTLTDSFRRERISGIIKLFAISILENSFYLLVEEQRVKINHNFDFQEHIFDYIKNHLTDFEDSPLLMIFYYLSMHYFYENNEKYFYTAKDYLRKHFNSMTKVDKKNIHSVMQIYYLKKMKVVKPASIRNI